MEIQKQVWAQMEEKFILTTPSVEHEKLDNGVYTVKFSERYGYYLVRLSDDFSFNCKIYGLETDFINRVLKTYEKTNNNLGVLLNGVKGTGKTFSSKIIANSIEQPTIIISEAMNGVQYFINSIPQNITVFIDEYEKIFGDSKDMLTIMDGAMNSEYRRLFLYTTNKLYIDDNLKQRPSRIRYIKSFGDLPPAVVEEIVDDCLVHKELKGECMQYFQGLSLITVDIIKAILGEVNIHQESPEVFGDVFNVEKVEGKYSIRVINPDGSSELQAQNVKIYPRPKFTDESYLNYTFSISDTYVGPITKIIDEETIEVAILDEETEKILDLIVLRLEKSYGVHSNYAYYGGDSDDVYGSYGAMYNKNAKKITGKLSDILQDKTSNNASSQAERIRKGLDKLGGTKAKAKTKTDKLVTVLEPKIGPLNFIPEELDVEMGYDSGEQKELPF